jgi:hypothetical protein
VLGIKLATNRSAVQSSQSMAGSRHASIPVTAAGALAPAAPASDCHTQGWLYPKLPPLPLTCAAQQFWNLQMLQCQLSRAVPCHHCGCLCGGCRLYCWKLRPRGRRLHPSAAARRTANRLQGLLLNGWKSLPAMLQTPAGNPPNTESNAEQHQPHHNTAAVCVVGSSPHIE